MVSAYYLSGRYCPTHEISVSVKFDTNLLITVHVIKIMIIKIAHLYYNVNPTNVDKQTFQLTNTNLYYCSVNHMISKHHEVF